MTLSLLVCFIYIISTFLIIFSFPPTDSLVNSGIPNLTYYESIFSFTPASMFVLFATNFTFVDYGNFNFDFSSEFYNIQGIACFSILLMIGIKRSREREKGKKWRGRGEGGEKLTSNI
jgi:hypothetical protein